MTSYRGRLDRRTGGPRVPRGASSAVYALLALPAVLYLGIFLLYPILSLLLRSFVEPELTLAHYHRIFRERVYLTIIANTFKISLAATGLCFAIGVPAAYYVSRARSRSFPYFIAVFTLPLWINPLAIIYAWMILLQRQGVVNQVLSGVTAGTLSLQLMYNLPGLLICMVHLLLPYMVLPVVVTLRRFDWTLFDAARNLGASRYQALLRVVLPLSAPGILVGCLLVCTLATGFFVTPALLGGRKETMIAMVIDDHLNLLLNWGVAAALTVLLLLVALIILSVAIRLLRLSHLTFGDEA